MAGTESDADEIDAEVDESGAGAAAGDADETGAHRATARRSLEQFGLTEKEIDTYLAVLEQGEATTSAIADEADVSKRYVYSTAERLADRGLVAVNDHSVPKTVRAVPPREAVDDLVEDVRTAASDLQSIFTESTSESAVFEVVKSRRTVVKEIREALASADDEVLLALPRGVVTKLLDDLRAAVDRGVTVLVLEFAVDNPGDPAERFAGAASVVRQWHYDMPFAATVDSDASLVGMRGMLTAAPGDERAVRVSQSQVASSMFGATFASFWSEAAEAYVAEPFDLPRTSGMMRPAVLQAALYDRRDAPLRARVDATPLDGDERCAIEGRVADVRQGIIEPASASVSVENALVLERPDGSRVSVGGEGAFMEDYQASEVTLWRDSS